MLRQKEVFWPDRLLSRFSGSVYYCRVGADGIPAHRGKYPAPTPTLANDSAVLTAGKIFAWCGVVASCVTFWVVASWMTGSAILHVAGVIR